jgi:hypothetical protein
LEVASEVARSVRTIPGVQGVCGGPLDFFSTGSTEHLVPGVVVAGYPSHPVVDVHVRVIYHPGVPLPLLADRIHAVTRRTLSQLGTAARINVCIDELQVARSQ